MNMQRSNERRFSHKAKHSRKRRHGIAQVFRGVVLEGMGALALISLYLTVNSTPAQLTSAAANGIQDRETRQPILQDDPVGHRAPNWTSRKSQSSSDVNRPMAIGRTIWSTWGSTQ